MKVIASLIASSLALAAAQQIGPYEVEEHPPLPTQVCTKAGGCKTEQTSLVLDANYRWLHQVGNYSPCRDGDKWNTTVCPDQATCAQNCAYEGVTVADYDKNYGVTVQGDQVELKYSDKYGARMYLLADDNTYKLYQLMNQEFSFDIDTATLECGMNGAVYFVPMQADGGAAGHPGNKVGAKYGMGYCDAQCPGTAFANGLANFGAPTQNGQWGQCCSEFDIWEANKVSTMFTSHPADKPGVYNCTNDVECGYGDNYFKGVPDKSGCGFNSYKNGAKQFYGPGSNFTVDTTKKMTVVTQFITDDNTANGNLVEVRRIYKQDGKVIANSKMTSGFDSVTDPYCAESVGTPNYHLQHGGLKHMGDGLKEGMVLAISIWADSSSQHMGWLDMEPAGSCAADSGDPAVLQKLNISVKFSNFRVGDINSTFSQPTPLPTETKTPVPTETKTPKPTETKTPKPTKTKTPKPTEPTVPKWGQCGGQGYTGPTKCADGYCQKWNDYFSQCV